MNTGPALALSLLAAALPLRLCAADSPPPQDVWTGKGQAGYLSSHGNSQARSANAALDMSLVTGPWKHAFHLAGLYGQSAGIVSAERWDTQWQTNYQFSPKAFVFAGLRYEHDMFSGFRYQASGTAGLGYKVVDSKSTQLSIQLGAGVRQLQPETITRDAAGVVIARTPLPSERNAVATAGLDYAHTLTATTSITDKLLVESGAADTLMTNALALAVKINAKLALSLGYNVQDNTKPPAGLRKIDTLETVNLVYSF
ncbi:MAG: DUF481 domain-containing protein [Gammaproteobacteria bacterium]|nr:DUF481 domain-containing protein [Gammaproteobacteria bacterium]